MAATQKEETTYVDENHDRISLLSKKRNPNRSAAKPQPNKRKSIGNPAKRGTSRGSAYGFHGFGEKKKKRKRVILIHGLTRVNTDLGKEEEKKITTRIHDSDIG